MSSPNAVVRLSSRAQRDYDNILLHSSNTWGEQQMIEQEERLARAFEALSAYPELGRLEEAYGKDRRKLVVGPHIVIYRMTNDAILISRILHHRQDIARHARES